MCEEADRRGAKIILLPTLPFGTQTNHRAFPLAMNLYPSTIMTIVHDLLESVVAAGIRKVILFNSHGGNDLKPILREYYGRTPAHLFLCFWPQVIKDACEQILENPDDHAGEMETSLAMAYFPEYVARNTDGSFAADDGSTRVPRFEALRQGWVSITRPWHLLTTNTGSGNPHAATADKGKRICQAFVARMASFLVELSQAKLDDDFPYGAA